ncbi:MAG TPA: X2-like carbohydrate binding domain-containing protein, partial [Clostridia bacterium]
LVRGTDFEISGDKVTIKKGYQTYYFSKFPEQNLNIIFRFSNGYDSILSIYPGVSPHSSITPSSIDYKVDSKIDVAVKAALNGNYFSSIKNGTSELVPRVDYTYSVTDNTLIIRKSYLSYYFSKFKKTLVLQINFTGGKPQTLSIVPEYAIS